MSPTKKSKKAASARGKPDGVAPAPQQSTATGSLFEVGAQVVHPIFGEGAVMAVDEHKLTIQFREERTRDILDAYVKRQS
jgi:hypothetical protein